MINHMIQSYVACLVLGWGLLFFDWAINEVEKHPRQSPGSAMRSPLVGPLQCSRPLSNGAMPSCTAAPQ